VVSLSTKDRGSPHFLIGKAVGKHAEMLSIIYHH
jgi:hypothetical protein